MQRHIPMGYQIVGGRAEVLPEAAKIVRQVFEDYLNGASTNQIARNLTEQGVLNASHKPSWNHGTVGKMLENQKYKGDSFYPPLIDDGMFEQVQEKRRERAEKLGRTAQLNSYANKNLFHERIICGICGQPYQKYVERGNQPDETACWKCKQYIKRERMHCGNRSLTEKQIEDACLGAVNYLIKNPLFLERESDIPPKEPENAESRKLTGQIQECLESGRYSAEEIRRMVFERARAQYRAAARNDSRFQTEKLKSILADQEPQTKFDPELFRQIIEKIVVQKESILEIRLKNGAAVHIRVN